MNNNDHDNIQDNVDRERRKLEKGFHDQVSRESETNLYFLKHSWTEYIVIVIFIVIIVLSFLSD